MRCELFTRVRDEPILSPDCLPMEAAAVFNPGVALLEDEVLLLLRVEDRRGLSHLRVARSRNGVDDWRIAKEPLLAPGDPDFPFEEWGCEDARITHMDDGTWMIVYTGLFPLRSRRRAGYHA